MSSIYVAGGNYDRRVSVVTTSVFFSFKYHFSFTDVVVIVLGAFLF